jgi:hypothetical protein
MSTADQLGLDDIQVDTANLYREEIISDRKVAQLRKMVPITVEGAEDPARPVLYSGSTSIMLPTGPLPVSCEIEADTLQDACDQFPAAIKNAVEEMIDRVQKMQFEESKRIVTPNELGGDKGGLIL